MTPAGKLPKDRGREAPQRPGPEETPSQKAARQFASGIDGEIPTPSAVQMVERIARAVLNLTESYVYSVDEDGAFSFDARLTSGRFIMCEVDPSGEINAGLYHSPTGPLESFQPRMTEAELLAILRTPAPPEGR